MSKETVLLTGKEQQRIVVLNRIERGELSAAAGAEVLQRSLRQVRRLLAAYRKEGVAAIAHGNRGRRPAHAVDAAVREQVIALARGRYAGCNHQHLMELLAEHEGIVLSHATVWRLLTGAGQASPRRRRPPRHRARRERYRQEGMLLQLDASPHDWLEGRGPRLSLIAAIDDATGTMPAAVFRQEEDAHGYFLLLRHILQTKGLPLAVYTDKHGIFRVNQQRPETLEEQLAGTREPTQFGRALAELGVSSILADSPQAKGRVERLLQTLQDRLVSELRLAGTTTEEDANRVLQQFLPHFNTLFGVPPAQPGSAYRPLPPELELERVLCFKYQRTVGADNTIRFGGTVLQLLPSPERASYARAKVEVQERLDGSLAVCHERKIVATRPAPPSPATLRARGGPRGGPGAWGSRKANDLVPQAAEQAPERAASGAGRHKGNGRKPAPDHPWKRRVVTKSQKR